MDMVEVITFCKQHNLAERLKLSEASVLKSVLDEIYMQLDAEVSPQEVAHSALTVLEIVASNGRDDANKQVKPIRDLEGALTAVIESMQAKEKPFIYLKDTAPILTFIEEYKISQGLKLDADLVKEILLKAIAWEVGIGHSYEQAAQMALTELDFIAVDTHIATNEEDFDLSYPLEKELMKAIAEAYK